MFFNILEGFMMKSVIENLLKEIRQISLKQGVKEKINSVLNENKYVIHKVALLGLISGDKSVLNNIPQTGKNSYLLITNAVITKDFNLTEKINLLIYKEKIIATSTDLPDELPLDADSIIFINADDKLITSGLIEQHIHGGYGCDFNTASTNQMAELLSKLPAFGITSILPTIMTASEQVIKKQIDLVVQVKNNISDLCTKIQGIHLEGPCICPEHKGIHPIEEIIPPSVEFFKRIESPEVKIVSYAPELDKNYELTKYLAKNNIIPSAGHTDASLKVIQEAAGFGLRQVTHLFNAMVPLHHRNPGVIGESLVNDNLFVEIIADGLHLNPSVVDLVLRAKPESKIILISDSLPLNNYSQDSIIFGGQMIHKQDGKAVSDNNTMAGSMIFVDSAINNLKKWHFRNYNQSLRYATANVADNLGLNELGIVAKGKTADLVIWNDSTKLSANTTIINGKIVYQV